MSLMSHGELCALIDQGVIQGGSYDAVNSASIDIHLGSVILTETHSLNDLKYLDKKSSLNMQRVELTENGTYVLGPGEFILAQSREIFNLPNNISAEYKLKSSMARLGLDHLNAGWADAGWTGSVLTLELKNVTQGHRIVLTNGDRIGQMVFFQHLAVPSDKSYASRGSYNNDKTVQGVKTK